MMLLTILACDPMRAFDATIAVIKLATVIIGFTGI
jgi:hypothetical protein